MKMLSIEKTGKSDDRFPEIFCLDILGLFVDISTQFLYKCCTVNVRKTGRPNVRFSAKSQSIFQVIQSGLSIFQIYLALRVSAFWTILGFRHLLYITCFGGFLTCTFSTSILQKHFARCCRPGSEARWPHRTQTRSQIPEKKK